MLAGLGSGGALELGGEHQWACCVHRQCPAVRFVRSSEGMLRSVGSALCKPARIEAVARLGSLRAAADELGVTPGAVSQQIIKAEGQLDRTLFVRHAKGLTPTDLGRDVAARLADGFAELTRGVALTRRSASDAITISVAPVCAPAMAERLSNVSDLARVPIIREPRSMSSWDVRLAPNGMGAAELGEGPVFSDASPCLDAAVAGQGVFLAWKTLAQDALSMGRLVAPFPGRIQTGISYWFVEPEERRRSRQVEAFRSWLVKELRASGYNRPVGSCPSA